MATATVPSVVDASVPSAPVLPPGSKVICGFCLTEESALWMSVDLFLQPSQCSVYNRLSDMGHSLQQHCLLCAHCYTLVERWDEYMALAKKTQQLLEKRARYPKGLLECHGEMSETETTEDDDRASVASAKEDPSVTTLTLSIPLDVGDCATNTSDDKVLDQAKTGLENACQEREKTKSAARRLYLRRKELGYRVTRTGKNALHLCKFCNKSFVRYHSLLAHERRHETGDVEHVCTICSETLPTLNQLVLHRQNQHHELVFKCDFCPRLFNRKQSKHRHEVGIHTGERRYRCPLCGVGFNKWHMLNRHRGEKHGLKPLTNPFPRRSTAGPSTSIATGKAPKTGASDRKITPTSAPSRNRPLKKKGGTQSDLGDLIPFLAKSQANVAKFLKLSD